MSSILFYYKPEYTIYVYQQILNEGMNISVDSISCLKGESLLILSHTVVYSWLRFQSQLTNPHLKCQKQIIVLDFY